VLILNLVVRKKKRPYIRHLSFLVGCLAAELVKVLREKKVGESFFRVKEHHDACREY